MSEKGWISVLKQMLHLLYRLLQNPFIAAIIITGLTAYVYHTRPFEPPGTQISYSVEKYINEPDGSYMKGICVWNSGSKDIPDLDLKYYFENYKSVDVLDREFNIINRLINASPKFGKSIVVNKTDNSMEVSYPLFTRGSHFREQFYINKPSYPITISSGTTNLDIKPEAPATCDPCSC